MIKNEEAGKKKVRESLISQGCKVLMTAEKLRIGVPDMLVAQKGHPATHLASSTWIEAKYALFPAEEEPIVKLSMKHGISGPQLAFLEEWWHAPDMTALLVLFQDESWIMVPAPALRQFISLPGRNFKWAIHWTPLNRVSIKELRAAAADSRWREYGCSDLHK